VPILPVILWTDALIYLLLAAVAGFVWYVRRHEHLRAPWWRVAQTPAAMSSLVVLSVFILIGLLDSVHFRLALPAAPRMQTTASRDVAYAVEVKSALDLLLASIANKPERTYSAPLATHAYSKETVESPGENEKQVKQVRDYPRLQYGGAHLQDPLRDWQADVLLTGRSPNGHVCTGARGFPPFWIAIVISRALAEQREGV